MASAAQNIKEHQVRNNLQCQHIQDWNDLMSKCLFSLPTHYHTCQMSNNCPPGFININNVYVFIPIFLRVLRYLKKQSFFNPVAWSNFLSESTSQGSFIHRFLHFLVSFTLSFSIFCAIRSQITLWSNSSQWNLYPSSLVCVFPGVLSKLSSASIPSFLILVIVCTNIPSN